MDITYGKFEIGKHESSIDNIYSRLFNILLSSGRLHIGNIQTLKRMSHV